MSSLRPHRFDFFQLVAWLQRSQRTRALVGHLGSKGIDSGDELLRFRSNLSLDFPARDVERIEHLPATEARDDRVRLEVNFGGIYGADSPLPTAFTEYLLQQGEDDAGDDKEAVRDFLDVFQHRLYSLLYRTWEKYRFHATFDPEGRDDISRFLFALVGLGTPALREAAGVRDAFDSLRMLRYGGLTTQRPRSAAVLRAVLQDYLGETRVRIRQFIERRVDIPEEDRTVLTRGGRDASGKRRRAPRLGHDTVLGCRLRDRAGKFRVVVGPVGLDEYFDLLPGTPRRRGLDALVQRTAPRHLSFEVQVTLRGEQVPPLILSSKASVRLGWSSWTTSRRGGDQDVLFGARPAAQADLVHESTAPALRSA